MRTEEITILSHGIKLRGTFYIPSNLIRASYPTVCVCHGIPSPSPRAPEDRGYPALAEQFCENGLATLIFNFRGTGRSEGSFSLNGWSEDLTTMINYLHEREEVEKSSLATVGFSGGAIVAVYNTARDGRIKAIVTCACPAEASGKALSILKQIVEAGLKMGSLRGVDDRNYIEKITSELVEMSPLNWVDKISPRPLAIVHGDQDEYVDVNNAYKLFQKAGEPKDLKVVIGGQHKLRLNREAIVWIINWLKNTLASG
jgi:alpha/beta superfamily hydrolase